MNKMATNVRGMHVVNFVAASWTSKLVRLLVHIFLFVLPLSLVCVWFLMVNYGALWGLCLRLKMSLNVLEYFATHAMHCCSIIWLYYLMKVHKNSHRTSQSPNYVFLQLKQMHKFCNKIILNSNWGNDFYFSLQCHILLRRFKHLSSHDLPNAI